MVCIMLFVVVFLLILLLREIFLKKLTILSTSDEAKSNKIVLLYMHLFFIGE